jgi:hypothetical protein
VIAPLEGGGEFRSAAFQTRDRRALLGQPPIEGADLFPLPARLHHARRELLIEPADRHLKAAVHQRIAGADLILFRLNFGAVGGE